MGYVGNQQTEGFSQVPAKQDFTNITGTSLTLTHAVASAEGIDLFINNVRQEPTTAYSIEADGVTVTLTGSVVASDDIYVVYNSLALQTTVTPDASVSTAKIIDGSVTSTKLAATIAPTNLETTASTFKMTDLSSNAFYRTDTFAPIWTSANVTTAYESNLFTAASYATQRGDYVRIGNLVHATIYLGLDHSAAGYANSGSHSQSLGIYGLPFKVKNITDYNPMTSTVYFSVDTDQGWSSYNLVGIGRPDKKHIEIFFSSAGGTVSPLQSGHVYGLPTGQGIPASSNAHDTSMLFQLTYETDEA